MLIRRGKPSVEPIKSTGDGQEVSAQGQSLGAVGQEGPRWTALPKEGIIWEDPAPIADRPRLSKEERALILRLRGKVHQKVVADFERGFARGVDMRDPQQLRPLVEHTAQETIQEEEVALPGKLREVLVQEVLDEIVGYGPLQAFLDDPTISEIMVNSAEKIFYERRGRIYLSDQRFDNDEHVLRVIDKILSPLGRQVNERIPLMDARLPDGSRVNVIIPPLAIKGPSITIRKFSRKPLTIEKLMEFGSLTEPMAIFLQAAVQARLNIIVSGGTGSGKTTMLNVLSNFIPPWERLVTVEDAAELQLQHENWVALEARPANIEGVGEITIRDLVRNALRMRPDRIIVGECRGAEALDMIQAMNTGHDGSMSTLHSNSPRDTIYRLETMIMMAGMELPQKAIARQIASAIHLIVHQARLSDGTRKITHITEVQGLEGDTVLLQDIFIFEQKGIDSQGKVIGRHRATGFRPLCAERIRVAGFPLPEDLFFEA